MENNEKIVVDELSNCVDNSSLIKNSEEYLNLEKKLKKTKRNNIVLSILLAIFIIIFITIIVSIILIVNNVRPMMNKILNRNYNLASISQFSDKNNIDIEKFTTKLAFIDDVINIMYYYDKDNEKIEDAMFTGYMSALGDKYAEYYPRQNFEEFTEKTTEGVYYGIGCVVTQNRETKDCIVETVYEDSPAEKAGFLKDDVFVSVNGENVRGLSLDELISKIRGEEGAKREVEVYRKSTDNTVLLTVYCGKVDIKQVTSEILENNIGYLDVNEFTGKAAKQFKDEIDKLLNKNINGMIIDLRDNPGGELQTVCEMIDYILRDNDGKWTLNQDDNVFDEGKTLLVYIKEKEEITDAAYATDKHSVDIPIVILTNLNTASAAELFTECLRDYGKAEVVGIRTYGKGVVQNIIPYEDGSAIKFTVSEYFPPSGYSINQKGITPDYSLDYMGVEIEYDENNNIIVNDDGETIIINNEGQVISEKIATISTASFVISDNEEHIENKKIYDDNNSFTNEDWYIDLDVKYEDKQLLQAIVLLTK